MLTMSFCKGPAVIYSFSDTPEIVEFTPARIFEEIPARFHLCLLHFKFSLFHCIS